MTNQAAQTMPPLPKSFGEHCVYDSVRVMREPGYTSDQMHQYARDYAALLAAAPAASGGEGLVCEECNGSGRVAVDRKVTRQLGTDSMSIEECCDKCGGVGTPPADADLPGMWERADLIGGMTDSEPQPPSATSVSERARTLLAAEYEAEGWRTEAGACRRGSLDHADRFALSAIGKIIEQGDEDDHVITELGRLLASIAVILKGPEPAGTAWSYHDLPGMVNRLKAERDSAPSLEQALTQQRGGEPAAWMVEWTDNAGDPTRYIAYCEEDAADKLGVLSDGEAATAKVVPLYTTPQPRAGAVREYVTELRAQADQKMGVAGACAHDGDRARYKSAAQLLRRVADELESLLSGGSHA